MRRFRFSLRQLLVLVTILAVSLTFGGKRVIDARKQRQLISLIQSYGGEHHHNLNFKGEAERTIRFPNTEFSPKLPGPEWMRNRLGEEYFVSVVEAFFDKPSHRALDDTMFAEYSNALRAQHLPRPQGLVFSEVPITDSTLGHLDVYPDLRSLHVLNCPAITDTGLRHIKSLKNLRRLDLRGSSITDSGLANLSELTELRELSLSRTSVSDVGLTHLVSLTKLEWLRLSNTAVTSDGRKKLNQHLPKCEITW